jgi:pyrroline-5-carboxylate reductase
MKILVYGCGNMARAFSLGLMRSHKKVEFLCWNPSEMKAQKLSDELKGKVFDETMEFDALILGFKPQQLNAASIKLTELIKSQKKSPVILSLLAGVEMARIQSILGVKSVIRLMPNLAIKSGEGVLIWSSVEADQKFWSEALSAMGYVQNVPEAHIDIYTPHAGCSPAFVYYWLIKAGEVAKAHGADSQIAQDLFLHALRSAVKDEIPNPQKSIEQVASKGGVTEAIIKRWSEQYPNYIEDGFMSGLEKMKELKKS